MEKIFTLGDNIKSMFENYKAKYPNLKGFEYDAENDILYFNGNSIKQAGYSLSRMSPVFFQMIPQDIFDYIKNGLFYQSTNEISKVYEMLRNEMIITEEESAVLKNFVGHYFKRLTMFMNNSVLFSSHSQDNDITAFVADFNVRKEIIEQVVKGNFSYSVASDIIRQELANLGLLVVDDLNQQQNVSQDNSLEKGMSLTRKKNNSYVFLEQEEVDKMQNLGMAGFASIVLVLATAVTVGTYLATLLLQ